MSRAVNWRTLRGERHAQFMVKGTELAAARYGDHGRFLIVEYRWYDADHNADRRYRVRDAHKVTDAQIREGGRSPIVADFTTLGAAIAFCDGAAGGECEQCWLDRQM